MNLEHSHSQEIEVENVTHQQVEYAAPAIESVLTPQSLEREVHYAGLQQVSGPTPA